MTDATSERDELLRRFEHRQSLMVPASPSELRGLKLFKGVPEKAREKVVERVCRYIQVAAFPKGDLVLREGEYSDSAFYIIDGKVEIDLGKAGADTAARVRGGAQVGTPRKAPGSLADTMMIGRGTARDGAVPVPMSPTDLRPGKRTLLGPEEFFGELSALSRYPVSANVRADTEVRLLQIRLPGLRMLMAASKEFKRDIDDRYRERTLARHLRNVDIFAHAGDGFLEEIRRQAELVMFPPRQMIVAEGSPADAFFLVRGGYLKVSVRVGEGDLALTYLRKGDYAGEAALLLDSSWPFTLQALDYVELVKLPKATFEEIVRKDQRIHEDLWAVMLARLKARGAATRLPASSEYVNMAMETGLINGESVLLIDLTTCTRCDDCVRGCADVHGGEPRFVREGLKYRNWLVPTGCYQCTDPACMVECPTGAIRREIGTLEVTIDEATCIGCGNCSKRCPWGNIFMVPRGEQKGDGQAVEVATKCDLCLNRPEGPACVQMCPHGSAVRISFKDLERVTATLT